MPPTPGTAPPTHKKMEVLLSLNGHLLRKFTDHMLVLSKNCMFERVTQQNFYGDRRPFGDHVPKIEVLEPALFTRHGHGLGNLG